VRKLKAQMAELRVTITKLRAENATLQALGEHYAHITNELSIDHEQVKAERDSLLGNVRALPGRSKPR
jgi:FtsZ-binding cell division protein ZapB